MCDITETDYNYDYAVNSHMNHALRIYKDCIITNVCDKNTEGKWKMNVTTIDKKLLLPLARFEALRFREETHEPSEAIRNYFSDSMIISPIKGRASVAGREYEFEPVDCGYIPIKIAAMYIGGGIKENDDSISVTFGKKVCEMRINEKQYTVNGNVKEAELPVINRNGTVYIPTEILQRAFDKKIHTLTDGVFVVNTEAELNSDIWRADRY